MRRRLFIVSKYALKKLGRADIAAVVAELERQSVPMPERPESAVGNAIYATLSPRGLIEPADKRGWWRVAA